MNQQEFSEMVNQNENQILEQRGYRNLASAVAAMARIEPHGTSIIFLIGRGYERTNLEALTGWVKKTYQYGVPWEYESDNTVEDCYIKLKRKLGR